MRVLAIGNVYPPHHLGGYEVIWRGVMGHLRSGGHAVRVLSTDHRQPDVCAEAGEDPDVHRELEWYWSDHEWRSLGLADTVALERRNAARLDRHLQEFSPDVVCYWPLGGLSLSLVERVRRAGLPAVFFVLDYWFSYGRERDLWLRRSRRLGPAAVLGEWLTGIPVRVRFAQAGRWVFCSETARENTAAAGLTVPASTILAPGVDPLFASAPREPEAPPWRGRLLYIGRVVEQKGVATAIKSVARLPDEVTLRVVGDGDRPYRSRLHALAARLGVAERVSFDPALPRAQLIDVYRSADVVVFPVEWPEPFGLVPLEAMALGRPVIATGRGGSGDYLADRANALLFEAGNAPGLAAAVQTLSADPALRERLRTGGYATAERHPEAEFNRRATAELEAAVAGLPPPGPASSPG